MIKVRLLSGLLVFFLLGCSSYKKYKELSPPEKRWALTHPFVAKKALLISQEAEKQAKAMEKSSRLDGDPNGGQVDAFRHSYWMARLSQEISWRKAIKLGKAHEKGNELDYKKGHKEEGVVPDKASVQMDLFNNRIGVMVGRAKPDTVQLIPSLVKRIKAGEMRIIHKDCKGNSLDSTGVAIPKQQWQGKWENDRHLVPSNHKPDC